MYLRILYPLLVFRIVLQVLAPLVGSIGRHDDTDDAGRQGDHQHLRDGHSVAVGVGNRYESDHCGSDRRAGDSNLGGYRGHCAWPFRTDVFLDGDVHDNRHQGIDDMSGTDQDSQEEGAERSEERDPVRMPAEQLLSQLDEPVHATGCLEDSCAGYRRYYDVDYISRGFARLHPESEHQDSQTDA